MKTKLEVTRIDEYEVEIDEQVWTEQALADWCDTFWDVEDLQGLSKALATAAMRYGANKFMEGFGYVRRFRPDGSEITQYEKDVNGEYQEITDFAKGLSVIVHSDDENYYCELSF